MDVPFDKTYYTLGHLCQAFQRPIGEIKAVLSMAGVKPAIAINDVLHFDANAYLVLGRLEREAERDGE